MNIKWNKAVSGKGLKCRFCGEPAKGLFLDATFATCESCRKHTCGLCEKPHPEVKLHDGLKSEHPSDVRKRCPTCSLCVSCGTAKVPDRYEIHHHDVLDSLHVHIGLDLGMRWLVAHHCESCLLSNPHWKHVVAHPTDLEYRMPTDYWKVGVFSE